MILDFDSGLVDPKSGTVPNAAGELCFLHLDASKNVTAMCGKHSDNEMLDRLSNVAETPSGVYLPTIID